MRRLLLYDPRLLCERLAEISLARRRLATLRGTVAARLSEDHIDSMELLQLIRPLAPKVIYDVGANVGTWTLLAKALYPPAEVHAFEPLAVHHEGFERNTRSVEGVQLHRLALGESAGTLPIRVTSFSDASSLLPLSRAGEEQWHIHEVAQEQVPVERLDAWQQQGPRPLPSIIKLDVQGFELGVLRGAARCLEHTSAVLAEVSFREFYEGQCLFHDVVAFLAERGFTLHALARGTALGRPLVTADALFVANCHRALLPR
ncbi:MAG: FkbM family methyltransferase [Acidobacteriota bacterium]|nr:FkbM family methyltransferase [Acidobacteriota bacterium]